MSDIVLRVKPKHLFLLAGLAVLFIAVAGAVAVWNDSVRVVWHDAADVKITVDGTDYSLQEAIGPVIQRRVSDSCPEGSSLSQISETGEIVCETDDLESCGWYGMEVYNCGSNGCNARVAIATAEANGFTGACKWEGRSLLGNSKGTLRSNTNMAGSSPATHLVCSMITRTWSGASWVIGEISTVSENAVRRNTVPQYYGCK